MKGESTEQASVRKVTIIHNSYLVYSCLSISEFTFYNNQPTESVGNILNKIKFCHYSLNPLVSFFYFWITANSWTSTN